MIKLVAIAAMGTMIECLRLQPYLQSYYRGENGIQMILNQLIYFFEQSESGSNIIPYIKSFMEELDKKYPESEVSNINGEKDIVRISMDDAVKISKEAEIWKVLMIEELISKKIIEMTLESGLNVDELYKLANGEPSFFFAENIWHVFSDIEISDFSDAARCLLLGSATPSCIIALRGAEASIRKFYRTKTGTEPKSKTWRQLTRELGRRADELGLDERFISYLDLFGDAKRNQAAHPNKIYSLREAVLIFIQIVSLVDEIYSLLI